MEIIYKGKAGAVASIMLAISLPFILYFVEPFFPEGYLRYGYTKRFIYWTWLLLLYLYTKNIEKEKFLLWSQPRRSRKFYIISIISIIAIVFVSASSRLLLVKLGLGTGTGGVLSEMIAYLQQHPDLLVFTCFTAAIVEELLFRGYLIPRLNLLFNNGYAPVIISALVFAMAHFGYGTIISMWEPLLIGLIFGAYYQKYRNLTVLMICHFLIDFISLISTPA